jgi:hypothetical protein
MVGLKWSMAVSTEFICCRWVPVTYSSEHVNKFWDIKKLAGEGEFPKYPSIYQFPKKESCPWRWLVGSLVWFGWLGWSVVTYWGLLTTNGHLKIESLMNKIMLNRAIHVA